jgi:hypothetical protein
MLNLVAVHTDYFKSMICSLSVVFDLETSLFEDQSYCSCHSLAVPFLCYATRMAFFVPSIAANGTEATLACTIEAGHVHKT